MNTKEQLEGFIEYNLSNNIYSKNVAHSVGTALRVLGAVLNDEEKKSFNEFRNNLSNIAERVFLTKENNLSPASLSTYKSRLIRLLNDYHRNKLNVETKKDSNSKSKNDFTLKVISKLPHSVSGMHHINLALRKDAVFTLIVPRDVTTYETKVMKSVLDSLSNYKHEKK